jgi:hypothetical protein
VGILKRIKGRVSSGVELVKEGISAIQEEAKYPGRPPSHRAADDPLWQDSPRPDPATKETVPAPKPPPVPAEERPVEEEAPGGGAFWFLDGENDGWEETNPNEGDESDESK